MTKKEKVNRIILDDIQDCYIVGDIHGEYGSLLYSIKWAELQDCLIICAGDCGMGFTTVEGAKNELSKLRKYCNNNNIHVFFVRGNHDNPEWFEKKVINFPNVKCIPDYTVVTYNNNGTLTNILCIGGATSIDRNGRLKQMLESKTRFLKYHPTATYEEADDNIRHLYWDGEQPVFDPDKLNAIKEAGLEINMMCTHTCPSFCTPTHKNGIEGWLLADKTLSGDLDRERETIDQIRNKLLEDGHPIEKWIYGHYHFHNSEVIDGTMYVLLDMARGAKCDMYRI